MPMYQTKTIASILEPVAQQVSKLIILHEEGEDGNAMPDLEKPVQVVRTAVKNLLRVGQDTIFSSQDVKLRHEMPRTFDSIQRAADLLQHAVLVLKSDPFSKPGRDCLIEGSRGILQGTTNMLVIFDESQVRKLCAECQKVQEYLAITEVVETIEDLVQFVKDLSPCLTKVCTELDGRNKDLLNPYLRDNLNFHLNHLKSLAPVLICAMKISIQILNENGLGMEKAIENRNYLSKRMNEEVEEILSILNEPMGHVGSKQSENSGVDLTFHEIVGRTLQSLTSSGQVSRINVSSLFRLGEIVFKIAEEFEDHNKLDILDLCNQFEREIQFFREGDSSQQELAKVLFNLQQCIDSAVISRIIQDMADIVTPLKQYSEEILVARDPKWDLVELRGQNLKQFTDRLVKTAYVAAISISRNTQTSKLMCRLSVLLENLLPYLINAGSIRLTYPENNSTEENFENLRRQFSDGLQTIRDLCDESIDLRTFLIQTEEHVCRHISACEDALLCQKVTTLAENVSCAAKLSNRLLATLCRESDNSEELKVKQHLDLACERLKSSIRMFVETGKSIVLNIDDSGAIIAWKSAAIGLLDKVKEVTKVFVNLNMFGILLNNSYGGQTPSMPHPPTPQVAPPRPPPPTEDDVLFDGNDVEEIFLPDQVSNKSIQLAANRLYHDVKQWDHTQNGIVCDAKNIAVLMATLSKLTRGGNTSKRKLIECSKGLSDATESITEQARELADHCTDKKIKANLLQACEKVPTLGTQLRVLSTVKATMIGQFTDPNEDQEAIDMLVFNSQKLNQAVKELVVAAEAASGKVRPFEGYQISWVRSQPGLQKCPKKDNFTTFKTR